MPETLNARLLRGQLLPSYSEIIPWLAGDLFLDVVPPLPRIILCSPGGSAVRAKAALGRGLFQIQGVTEAWDESGLL